MASDLRYLALAATGGVSGTISFSRLSSAAVQRGEEGDTVIYICWYLHFKVSCSSSLAPSSRDSVAVASIYNNENTNKMQSVNWWLSLHREPQLHQTQEMACQSLSRMWNQFGSWRLHSHMHVHSGTQRVKCNASQKYVMTYFRSRHDFVAPEDRITAGKWNLHWN